MRAPSVTRLAQTPNGLQPTKDLFDPFADLLAHSVAFMARCAPIDGGPLVFAGDMRRRQPLPQAVDKDRNVITFVGANRNPVRARQVFDHFQGRMPLGRAIGLGKSAIDHQAVAVFHQGMPHEAQLRFLALAFAQQPAVRIGGGLMGLVLALLAFEVHFGIAAAGRWRILVILGAKAFHRCPGFNQGAVHGEVFLRQQSSPLRTALDSLKKRRGHLMFDKPVPVFGKGRMIPDLILQGEPDEPTKKQIVIQLLDQHPLAANGIEHLQQRSAQQLLRRNRWTARVRVHLLEQGRQILQGTIDHNPNGTQRMVLGDPCFRGNIAEHGLLLWVVAAHKFSSANSVIYARNCTKITSRFLVKSRT